MYKARSNNCRDITIMQTKVTPRQKMKRQVNFIFLANCISQTMDKEMWISVFMHWRIQVMGPGGHRAPPPLIPLIFQTKLRPEGPRKFFLRPSPLPTPQAPRFWRSGSASIMSLFSCSLQESSCQSNDVSWCHTASNSLDCRRARHCASTIPRKLPKECQTKLLKKVGDLNLERY